VTWLQDHLDGGDTEERVAEVAKLEGEEKPKPDAAAKPKPALPSWVDEQANDAGLRAHDAQAERRALLKRRRKRVRAWERRDRWDETTRALEALARSPEEQRDAADPFMISAVLDLSSHRSKGGRGGGGGGGGGGGDGSDSDDEDEGLDGDGADGSAKSATRLADVEPTQIFICSRTHSQLTQFASELRATTHAAWIKYVALASRATACINPAVSRLRGEALNDKCLDLQSRKAGQAKGGGGGGGGGGSGPGSGGHTKRARGAGGVHVIGGGGSLEPAPVPAARGCAYRTDDGDATLRDHALSSVQDVEELVERGRRLGTCPYYGARTAVPCAHIVAVPYQSILHERTRESLGIDIDGSVIIIDEAHNLGSALSDMYAVRVSGEEIAVAATQIGRYLERYGTRLHPSNHAMVAMIRVVTKELLRFSRIAEPGTMEVLDFLSAAGIAEIDLYALSAFFRASQISKKVRGLCEHLDATAEQQAGARAGSTHQPLVHSLRRVEALVEALTLDDDHGRILVTTTAPAKSGFGSGGGGGGGGKNDTNANNSAPPSSGSSKLPPPGFSIKFLLLTPATPLARLAKRARAVILAGGTLAPLPTLRRALFPAIPDARWRVHTNGHVVDAAGLLGVVVARGPSGRGLRFTSERRWGRGNECAAAGGASASIDAGRSNHQQQQQQQIQSQTQSQSQTQTQSQNQNQNQGDTTCIDELGHVVRNLASAVPGGMVLFFTSYDVEEWVYSRWAETGTLAAIERHKRYLRDKRTVAVSRAVGSAGAADPSSDGIEATLRAYARAVAEDGGALLSSVVGGKLSEGINFKDDLARCVVIVGLPYPSRGDVELGARLAYAERAGGKGASSEMYEDLCMRAVNQSIGRAIRHARDHAVIVFADERFLSGDFCFFFCNFWIFFWSFLTICLCAPLVSPPPPTCVLPLKSRLCQFAWQVLTQWIGPGQASGVGRRADHV
jgi:chromosome transmission fidelity protein 1